MKLLLDANLSPRIVLRLAAAGYDASHVADHGLTAASDDTIIAYAAEHDYVAVTADTDLSMILSLRNLPKPSVVLLRQVAELRPDTHADLLVANLASVVEDLEVGAVVSLSPTRLAVRHLPVRSEDPRS